jgi:hypothetical protein
MLQLTWADKGWYGFRTRLTDAELAGKTSILDGEFLYIIIKRPLGHNGENRIPFHCGWGDGHYPVIGSCDAQGQLLAAQIDFFVIP